MSLFVTGGLQAQFVDMFTFIQEGANQFITVVFYFLYFLCNVLTVSYSYNKWENPVGYCVIVDLYVGSETYLYVKSKRHQVELCLSTP